jgi:hypothetical protein
LTGKVKRKCLKCPFDYAQCLRLKCLKLEEPEDKPLTRELPEVNRKLEYRSQETLAFAKASEDKLEKWN